MAKFSIKKMFSDLGKFLEDITSNDLPSLSDKFAQAAFSKQGYEVVSRESFEAVDGKPLSSVTEATYLLKKDDKEYLAKVEGFYMPAYTPEAVYCGRAHSIKGPILPK